jgi:hypothetical protein
LRDDKGAVRDDREAVRNSVRDMKVAEQFVKVYRLYNIENGGGL